MSERTVLKTYKSYVLDHGLERRELFQLICASYQITDVLYPGCFLHVVPSFFFQHVIYVDKNPTARQFFGDRDGLLQLINANKRYKQPAYFRFIFQDYTEKLPLNTQCFDLLISLHAPDIVRHCTTYLRRGGLLICNDNRGEATQAASHPGYRLVAVVELVRNKYRLRRDELEAYFVLKRSELSAQPFQPAMNMNDRYRQGAFAYLFKKQREESSND